MKLKLVSNTFLFFFFLSVWWMGDGSRCHLTCAINFMHHKVSHKLKIWRALNLVYKDISDVRN